MNATVPATTTAPTETKLFLRVTAAVLPANEGMTLDLAATDAGNWTGGAVGSGALRGSKFGISAASYPSVDIASLTWDAALALYWRDFWVPLSGDALGPELATVVFDAAINHGIHRAIPWLQTALGVDDDGIIGDDTRGAIKTCDRREVAIAFFAERILFMPQTVAWANSSRGMALRLSRSAFEAGDIAHS